MGLHVVENVPPNEKVASWGEDLENNKKAGQRLIFENTKQKNVYWIFND